MTAMNFTHLATGIPTNCAMTWVQVIKYRLGFKNHVISFDDSDDSCCDALEKVKKMHKEQSVIQLVQFIMKDIGSN